MPRIMQVSDSVVIDGVEATTVWEQVADPTQMPRWSPENVRATLAPALLGRPLQAGETFVGVNRRGRARWVTECVVTASDPGKRFAFDVWKIGARTPVLRGRIATWAYDFEAVDGGTRVTETWTDARRGWPDWVAAAFDRTVTGGQLFAVFQQRNILRTLTKMKSEFEGNTCST